MALAADALSGPLKRAPTPSDRVSCDKSRTQPRRPFFHEDVFSRILGGPLVILHFALYCAVPVYYLVHYSPFSHFEDGTANQSVRWILSFLTQYLTAVLVVSWSGHYEVRRDVAACLLMGIAVFVVAGLRSLVEDTAGSKR